MESLKFILPYKSGEILLVDPVGGIHIELEQKQCVIVFKYYLPHSCFPTWNENSILKFYRTLSNANKYLNRRQNATFLL